MNRADYFADLNLSSARLDELSQAPDYVIGYFAPCAAPERREVAWRRRVAALAQVNAQLADVVETVRRLAAGAGTWLNVVAYLDRSDVALRLRDSGVSFADVVQAAGIHDACPLL